MIKRLMLALPVAVLVTGALFLLMHVLISVPPGKDKEPDWEEITLTRKIKDTESPRREPPRKPPEIREPASAAPRPDHEAIRRDIDINTKIRDPDGPPLPRGFVGEKPGLHSMDGPATPLVRGKPPYPQCGRGTGKVVLEFVVLPDGTVGPLKVVSAASSCFARAAERAARSWRYRPKVVDSEPVRSEPQRVTIIFIPE